MELLIFIVGCILVWLAVAVMKERDAEDERHSDDQIMAEYLEVEKVRAHYQRLAEIDATVRATTEELDRIASEAQGDVIEGRCREVTRP